MTVRNDAELLLRINTVLDGHIDALDLTDARRKYLSQVWFDVEHELGLPTREVA